MKKQYKLGVIGCSSNAVSFLRGVVLSDLIREKKIIVSDISEKKLNSINYLGVHTVYDDRYVAENSEYVILAIKTDNFANVVKNFEGYRPEKIISLIRGLTKSEIKNSLGIGLIKVARAVMNAPCTIGSGAIGIDMTDFNKSIDDTDFISNMFGYLGTVVSVDEGKLDAADGLSGCGPAYVYMFIDSLVDAGVKQGLTKDEAKILAVQTVMGCAEMVRREENTLNELLVESCADGNISVEAVKVFEDNGFRNTVFEAVAACTNKIRARSSK